MNGDLTSLITAAEQALAKIPQEITGQLRQIDTDPMLSDQGKRERRQQIMADAAARIAQHRADIDTAERATLTAIAQVERRHQGSFQDYAAMQLVDAAARARVVELLNTDGGNFPLVAKIAAEAGDVHALRALRSEAQWQAAKARVEGGTFDLNAILTVIDQAEAPFITADLADARKVARTLPTTAARARKVLDLAQRAAHGQPVSTMEVAIARGMTGQGPEGAA